MSSGSDNNKNSTSNSLSEAEKFLESLNLTDTSSDQEHTNSTSTKPTTATDRNDIMNFLDEISNYSNQDSQAKPSNTDNSIVTEPTSSTASLSAPALPTATKTAHLSSSTATASATNTAPVEASGDNNGGGWMSWGNSLLAQASATVKTTTDQINRTVQLQITDSKLLEERVKHLQGLVNKNTIEKLGTNLRHLTTQIMETVAPPISEHELVEIWLSHDMVGYSGVEALVYRAFARVLEQTESGQVIVRKGMEDDNEEDVARDLNMCEGVVEGTKLAKANVDHLIKLHYTEPETTTTFTPHAGAVPVINCPVFMVIQPVKTSFNSENTIPSQLMYAIVLQDPTNRLSFQTYSQSIPMAWLDIPYEENEWVEDKMVDVLRMAVTSIAQDYVWTRMTGGTKLAQAVEEPSKLHDQQQHSTSTETTSTA